jgi:hypothetical protein
MISKEKHIKRLLSSEIIENRGEEKEVLAENLETLRDFDLVLTAEGLSESALYNYANHLYGFQDKLLKRLARDISLRK